MLQAEALGYEGRYARLEPAIRESFDIATIVRMAAGGHWARLDAEQRRRLAERFEAFVISTYASRFDAYSGQKFETLGSDAVRTGYERVKTQIRRPGDEDVALNYVLRAADDGWRIADVHLDGGVSQVSIWRAEFASILSRKGFDSLMTELEKKIERRLGS